VVLLALPAVVWAAPSYVGMTGNIFTPDDLVLDTESFEVAYHGIQIDEGGKTRTRNIYSLAVGIGPDLEVGVASIDKNLTGSSTKTIFSGKYLISEESITKPSIVAGVVDATHQLDYNDIGSPSFFLVVSKTLNPRMEEESTANVPFKVHLGLGSGLYDGFFGGINVNLMPKVSIVGEYVRRSIVVGQGTDVFNLGARFSLTNNLHADIGMIDNRRLGFGISFTASQF